MASSQYTLRYKEFNNFANRKPDNIGIRTVDTFNQEGAQALNGVCPCLVKRFGGMDVPLNFLIAKVFKKNFRFNRFGKVSAFLFAAD